jgi:hypothetical protein
MAGKGLTWTWQRCGRYKYQKVLVHTTNPHHLVFSTPSLTDVPSAGWFRLRSPRGNLVGSAAAKRSFRNR